MTEPYRFGLVGHNVGYSRSGAIFRAVFRTLGIDGTFEHFDLSPDNFDQEFRHVLKSGVQGLSVTIPYKYNVIELLDDLDPVAEALRAVNSIHIGPEQCCGFNTDCYGFSQPLLPLAEKLKNGSALILGSGGGARAVVYALYTDYEIGSCTLMARDGARLKSCKQSLLRILPQLTVSTRQVGSSKRPNGDLWDIVVNCTPLGGWNQPAESPLPSWFDWANVRLYYDLNYNADNSVIAEARNASVPVFDGSAMLVGQALQSFYIWTGHKIPFDPIYQEVFGDRST